MQQMHAMPAELSKRVILPRWDNPLLMQVDAGVSLYKELQDQISALGFSSSRSYVSGDDRTAPSDEPMKNTGRVTKKEAAFV